MSTNNISGSSSASDSSTRGIKRKREDVSMLKLAKARKDTPDDAVSSSSEFDSGSGESDKNESDTKEIHVLSRAAKRKLRKKEQEKAEGHLPLSGSPLAALDAAPKRQHSVWVGNLAFKTTAQSLRAFFQRGVPGCEVTRVHLPTKTVGETGSGKGMRGENRGFAYVDFATKEVKEQAIALSEQNLDGRKLLIKDGADFTGRPTASSSSATSGITANSAIGKSKTAQRILAAQKQPPAPTLFLGNLGFQATEESIRTMLEVHMSSLQQDGRNVGPKERSEEKAKVMDDKKWLRKIRMGTFEDSGLCKGWAFLDFYNTEDATSALLDTRNHYLDGRKLVVEYASASAVRRGGGHGAKEHRDNSKKKTDTTQTGNQVRSEPKSNGKTQGNPTAEDPGDQCEPPQKKARRLGRERGTKGKRTKPGAALALAKREKVAIVPSSGKKIIF